MGQETRPEVFIIESLRLKDESKGWQEGEIISRMLRLSGKTATRYFYIRTERELRKIVALFKRSEHRYLHISCHADRTGMATTFDSLTYAQLGEILRPALDGRRVFVSACEMANNKLARELLGKTGCYSLIGPREAVDFDDAAAFWVAFYHLTFKANDQAMRVADLKPLLRELSALFEMEINYFGTSESAAQGFRLHRL